MKYKEIMKVLEVILLLTNEKESLLAIGANYQIEKEYLLRGAKIFRTLKEESSPEDNENFLPFIKTERIQVKGGLNKTK